MSFVFERATTVHIAQVVVNSWADQSPVSDGNSVFLFDGTVYQEISNLHGWIMQHLEGSPCADKRLNLSFGKVREIAQAILTNEKILQPGYFDSAPTGLQTESKFWLAKNGVIQPHKPAPKWRQKHAWPDLKKTKPKAWLKFLGELWPEHDGQEKIDAIQQFLGATMTRAPIQRALLLLGGGANGKSALLHCLANIVGHQHSTNISPDMMQRGNGEYYIYRLKDSRFNFCGELSKTSFKRTELLKSIIARDAVVGRPPYGNPQTIHPTCTHVFSTNHPLSEFEDSSFGWERRLLILGFHQRFDGRAKSFDQIWAEIKPEVPMILAWALEGACYTLTNQDIKPPDSSKHAMELVRMENPVEDFLEHACTIGGDSRSTDTYKAFVKFLALRGNDDFWSHKKFSAALVESLSKYSKRPKSRNAHGVYFDITVKGQMDWPSIN